MTKKEKNETIVWLIAIWSVPILVLLAFWANGYLGF